MNRIPGLLACLMTALAVACSSIPEVPVAAGSRVQARLYDATQGIELWLVNRSHPELGDIYSHRQADGDIKLGTDQLMGQLLASLDRAGLEEFGAEGVPDEARTRSRSYLFVQHDEVRRTFLQPAGTASEAERAAFARLKLVMNEYYRHVGGAQFVDNPRGGELLRGQRIEVPR